MAFPVSLPSNTDPTALNKLNSPSHSQLHQSHNAEIVAVETKVGTGSSTPTSGKVLRATGTGTSSWSQVDITTDVAIATSANLRSLLSDETGTGNAVFGTSPSITTPSITTSINDANGNEVVKTPATSSAINEVTITNAAAGNAPTISATGGDTNIDQRLTGKGTGKAYGDSINEYTFDFVVSGLVWSGDAYASTRAASMTAGFAYINGVRVTVAAVTARIFTASRDTYVDLSSSGVLTYTEVTNNAASPALAVNNIRVVIIVTGASTIASVGSVNQGQVDKILPIASSIPYSTTDSLGNLIYPNDSSHRFLGYKQILAAATVTTPTTATAVPGLTMPIIIPTGRRAKISIDGGLGISNSGSNTSSVGISISSASDVNRVKQGNVAAAASSGIPYFTEYITPSGVTGSQIYVFHVRAGTGNVTVGADPISAAFIKAELY